MIKEFNKIKLPSNEKFGNFFGFVFLVLSLYFYLVDHFVIFILFLCLSILTIFIRIMTPSILIYPNQAWMFLGLLLNKIVSPIILGVIFYVILMPVGVLRRLIGKDDLKIKLTSNESYWDKRSNEMLKNSSFKNQF